MAKKMGFQPDWNEEAPVQGSYRSIFKWGDPLGFKHPNGKFLQALKEICNMTDDDFREKKTTGNEPVHYKAAVKLSKTQVGSLAKIVGAENISSSEYDRLKFSTGKTIEEAMYLRRGKVNRVSDIVIHPRSSEDIQEVVTYCNRQKIPVYVFGGGSSVNFGLYPAKGGVTLVMSTHMNKIIELNETNQTVRVQAGMMGPAFEEALNKAPEKFGAKRKYTCGHFPQSFEYSSVGGWIVTLGSGQQSSYYGDAYDLVLSMEVVTPSGTIRTLDYPGTATGPKVTDILKGSEGTFGVVTEVTWKLYRYMPENRRYFGFIFPSWKDAVDASREISQSEFGMPAVFRISDEEETHMGLKHYGIDGTILDRLMTLRGFRPMERCLFLGSADGEKHFTANIKKQVKTICKKHGGMYLTGFATRQWEPGRYRDPYIREDLMDYGILSDTLETGVKWDNLHKVHQEVRKFVKSRPGTICMTHCSHFYPQGTNLYFIYFIKDNDIKDYVEFQDGIIDAVERSGGSLSHHHGVGRMIGPWMERHLGKEQMDVLRTLKGHFDPKNIMNPGGQMGLDLKGTDWRKIKNS
ncbi:MAG: FAD-binding oxidoreductase [Spirochaetae bacterium HGW-Spirochaetae-1]|nr:MAG: FAD-binding oxidoreductase [Spirochaetae bacterium HGW-Spirochaetae-1]